MTIRDRLRRTLGNHRADGVMRVIFGFPFLMVAVAVLFPVLIVLAALRAVVVIPLSILLGRRIHRNDEPTGRVLWGLWMWVTDNTRWVLTGSVGPKPTPTFPRPK